MRWPRMIPAATVNQHAAAASLDRDAGEGRGQGPFAGGEWGALVAGAPVCTAVIYFETNIMTGLAVIYCAQTV